MICLCSKGEWLRDTYGADSDEYNDYLAEEDGRAVCLLDDGHTGPHEWTAMGDVKVEVKRDPR